MKRHSAFLVAAGLAVAMLALANGGLSVAAPVRGAAARWVTHTADSGAGTLRQALAEAGDGDSILFDPAAFPAQQAVTIHLLSPLPDVHTNGLRIDGSDSWVVLDGQSAGSGLVAGLRILGSGATVRGLHIVGFAGYGIEVHGAENVIGGERSVGAGPLGQGNLLSGNGASGVGLFGQGAFSNTVRGNWIGVDSSGMAAWPNATDGVHINGAHHNLIVGNLLSGNSSGVQGCCSSDTHGNTVRDNWIGVAADGVTPLPNDVGVWWHDGASLNTIGPGNVIAHNRSGIQMHSAASQGNAITANRIYSNNTGIDLDGAANGGLLPPLIAAFDLVAGEVTGWACAGCRVEVFSDEGEQGALYEGQTTADATGFFRLQKGSSLQGPHLTAIATDAANNSSAFSAFAAGHEWYLQSGNLSRTSYVQTRRARDLPDNRIGQIFSGLYALQDFDGLLDGPISSIGLKRMRISVNEGDSNYIVWEWPETPIAPEHDAFISGIAAEGIIITYRLNFWDKAYHNAGGTVSYPRFTTEAEIQRYLDFVRYIVRHFRDRIQYYEIWNEPACDLGLMCIQLEDYLNLARRTIPVILEEYPQARIVFPSIAGLNAPWIRDYFFATLRSDLMPLVDVLTWHPLFGSSAELDSEYYYEYPSLVADIKRVATENGFRGEFMAEEFVYAMEGCQGCQPGDYKYSPAKAGKYFARAIVRHLGWDVSAGVAGTDPPVIRTLATLMAGVQPAPVPLTVQTVATQVVTATFDLPFGGHYVAFWTDGVALDDDPGQPLTLTLPGKAGYLTAGIDPLHGWQQPLLTTNVGNDLVIPGLVIRDYPILVRVAPARRVWMPVVGKE